MELPTRKKGATFEELTTLSPKAIWRQVKTEPLLFWCLCGYLFFEYVRPQTIYPWLDILPWGFLFSVSSFLLSFVGNKTAPKMNRIDIAIYLFFASTTLSIVFARYPAVSYDNYQLALSWLLIYVAIVRGISDEKKMFIFFLLYFLCNFKMTQHGFLTFAMRGFSYQGHGVSGAPGWFQNSGEFGIQLCIFIPMVTAFIIATKNHWNNITKLFMYLMPFTGIVSVVASSSRGALVGLIAALLWSLKATKNFFKTIIGLAILITVIWFSVPEESKARFQRSGEDRTSLHRLDRWELSWEAMKKYPLTGVGYKNWVSYFDNEAYTEISGSPFVHNIFFEAGAEQGFTGLIALLFILFTTYTTNVKIRKYYKNEDNELFSTLSKGMDCATIGLAISASFVTVLWYPYIWIHAAMCSALYNSCSASKNISHTLKSRATYNSTPNSPTQ